MKFKEIIKRITGISTPIFGISWNPDHTERDIARQVIAYLEDRRVLYAPCELERPDHCVESVLQIRKFLTEKIGETPEKTELINSLKAMRAACRKFLNSVGDRHNDIVRFGFQNGHYASWKFLSAVGELRGTFGNHITKIAVAYGIDVEGDLESTLPEEDKE
jgi:hypothetical protein